LSWPERGASPQIVAAVQDAIREAGHEAIEAPRAAIAGVTKSERDAFLLAVDRLHEADILIAEASAPSAAVGWEVAWFLARGRLVVVCCRNDARQMLSPMLAGNPSPWCKLVVYADAGDLRAQLSGLLVA
jgi:hypothetical protein